MVNVKNEGVAEGVAKSPDRMRTDNACPTPKAAAAQPIAAVLEAMGGAAASHKQADGINTRRAKTEQGSSQATRLVNLTTDVELFHTPEDRPYGTFAVQGHHETWPVRSTYFKQWLVRRFYDSSKCAPKTQELHDALETISAKAQFDGREHPVFTRVAEWWDNIYLDLGDSNWQAVEVKPSGWSIVSRPPVRFRRGNGMMALPRPEHGGSISSLQRFVNVKDEDWVLFVSWLIAAFRPKGPYPILGLHGEPGSAKTTIGKVARKLIDPFKAPMRTKPRTERDLMISASNSYLITLDNLSHLSPWLSDALCRLATGDGLATRQLYTDEEEIIFEAQRPVLLNGVEKVAVNGDLLDRMVIVAPPRIGDKERRPEAEFWKEFESARPLILGALLSGLSAALRNIDKVKLEKKPRMADFAIWASAAECELGLKSGEFIEAYTNNRREASDIALESSPLATEVFEFIRDKNEWKGTFGDLLESLNTRFNKGSGRALPISARALSSALTRLSPNLRNAGITLDRLPREAGTGRRLIRLENTRGAVSQPYPLAQPQAVHKVASDDWRDDWCDDVSGTKTTFSKGGDCVTVYAG
jgi:hypothetical protein